MNKFIDAKITQTSPIVKTWFSEDKLRELTAESLADDIERLDSEKLAKLYFEHVKVDGIKSHEPYKTQILDSPVGDVLCGIRFRGMDTSLPFVNVAVSTKTLTPKKMAESVAILAEKFADFSPKYVRFYVPSHLGIDVTGFNDSVAKWDRVLLANRFKDLTTRNNTLSEQGFHLEIAKNTDYYSKYKAGYDELFAQKPEFKDYTHCDDEAGFAEITEKGGFNVVLKQGEYFAGLLSLTHSTYAGLQGVYTIEKFILPSLHGRSLGSAMESEALQLLLNDNLVKPTDLFFGEIDYDNKGSLHSALNNGRVEVGQFLWLKI